MKSSTKRVSKYDSILKKNGGRILRGIRLDPESNSSLSFISNKTKLSNTKIINSALLFINKHIDLFEKECNTEK